MKNEKVKIDILLTKNVDFWRREWDSNPRWVAPSPVFKTGSLNRSDISPFIGTPEGIRIPDLPLRRRTLYPAELLGRVSVYSTQLFSFCQENLTHFPQTFAYNAQVVFLKGAGSMRESNDPKADLEDLIFDEDAGGPSQR